MEAERQGVWQWLKERGAEMRFVDFVLLALLFALQYPLWFGSGSWWNVLSLHQELQGKETVLGQLAARNTKLQAQVADLQTGNGAIEGLARRHLGMVGKGEIFVWVVPARASTNPPALPARQTNLS
ncbi:MAG: FtsB family cell division protein [Acidithiobacillus sp.]